MLTVTQRPDAQLYVNNPPEYQEDPYYISRWSSAHLPLVYRISNTKFPINTEDSTDAFSEVINNKGYARFNLSGGSYETYQVGEKVTVSGSALYDGIYEIKEVLSGDYVTLNIIFLGDDTGTIVRYYDNYNTLIRLYAGIPSSHPYTAQDPITLIGTYAIAPNLSNVAIVDVRDLVKQKISQDYDINGTGSPNDLNAWTSFYIEFSETYDVYVNSIPETFTDEYQRDLLDGCATPIINNGDFDGDLSGWSQANPPSGGFKSNWSYDSGAKFTQLDGFIPEYSSLFYQEVNFIKSISYRLVVDYEMVFGTYDKNGSFYVCATDSLSSPQTDAIYFKSLDGSFSENKVINFVLESDKKYLVFLANFPSSPTNGYCKINSADAGGDEYTQDCKAYIFAHNGTRQFFDYVKNERSRYAGNMAEYVQNYNGGVFLNKFLTRFEMPLLFAGKYFSLSSIIPQSTLDVPFTDDGLLLRIKQYNDEELISTSDNDIIDNGDGVYRHRIDDKVAGSDTATVQIIRKQTISEWFSVLIKSTASQGAYIGNSNNYVFKSTNTGDFPYYVDTFESQGAILATVDGTYLLVYKLSTSGWVQIYDYYIGVASITGVKAFNDNDWCIAIQVDDIGQPDKIVYSKQGYIQVIELPFENVLGVDGKDIDSLYFLVQDNFGYTDIYDISFNVLFHFGFPFAPAVGKRNITCDNNKLYAISDDFQVLTFDLSNNSSSIDQLTINDNGSCVHFRNNVGIAVGFTTNREVFFNTNGAWGFDPDFFGITNFYSDNSLVVSCCVVSADIFYIATQNRLYTKIYGTWTEGASGDYVNNNNLQVSGYFVTNEVELPISEIKTIEIDNNCSKQSMYLSWINTLGNWEYWDFTARKGYEKVIESVSLVRRNIYSDWPNNFGKETEDDRISVDAYDRVTVRSQYMTRDRLDIVSEILQSIRVQYWYSATEKITVKIDTDKLKKYSDGDKLYAIEFDVLMPSIQIQQQ